MNTDGDRLVSHALDTKRIDIYLCIYGVYLWFVTYFLICVSGTQPLFPSAATSA